MRRNISHSDVRFNMAPMIDVVFLLIIFFMLVSTFASAENVGMSLPGPDKSQAKSTKINDRVVVNCQVAGLAADGSATGVIYTVGPNPPESLERIFERVDAASAVNPKLKLVIRADKRLHYEQVRELLGMVARSKIRDILMVAEVGSSE